jgi:hypothetical protein
MRNSGQVPEERSLERGGVSAELFDRGRWWVFRVRGEWLPLAWHLEFVDDALLIATAYARVALVARVEPLTAVDPLQKTTAVGMEDNKREAQLVRLRIVMSIFNRFGHAFQSFWHALFGEDAEKVLAVVEANSPLVVAAKPVVADLRQLVPDTRVAVEEARAEVHKLLSVHFTVASAEEWIQANLGLNVPQLLQAAAKYIISKFPVAQGKAGSAINLAIELALQLVQSA